MVQGDVLSFFPSLALYHSPVIVMAETINPKKKVIANVLLLAKLIANSGIS